MIQREHRRGTRIGALVGVAALALAAGCGSTGDDGDHATGMTSSVSTPGGTGTADSTLPPSTPPPNTPPPSTLTISEQPTTVVTTPTDPTLVPPPPSTSEPPPAAGECPYLSDKQVMYANGQHTGTTTIIDVKPYPVCIFTRSSGGFLAATRIVTADSAAAATAAVNQHVPIDESFPVSKPSGWSGGAMATPDGLPGYPKAASIYAVSKGKIAIIAISNQKQSIKGRQMVSDIVDNLAL